MIRGFLSKAVTLKALASSTYSGFNQSRFYGEKSREIFTFIFG
jgi:hypothetical protein